MMLPSLSGSKFCFSLRNGGNAGSMAKPGGVGLQTQARPASLGVRSVQSLKQLKRARWCGVLIVSVYFIRATVLPWFLHIPASVLIAISGLALLLGAGVAIACGGKWRWSWSIVLLAFAASLWKAEQPSVAGPRWVGLALLIIAAGPMVVNPVAVEMRLSAWRLTIRGLTTLTGVFVVWYGLHLPSFGAGYFSSFMNQCMLAGPIAGMGVGIASARAIHARSWRWGVLAILGFVPVLASGSRIATLATVAGVCFLLIRRKPVLGLGLLIFSILAIYSFVQKGRNLESTSGSLTDAIAYKGNANTRADLWKSRILEFRSSPVFGIGIGMGTGNGASFEESGSIRVEPGSCYLAVLAMTGGLGTVAFFSAGGLLLAGFIASRQRSRLQKDILSVVGVYLAVHGIAEGWILSFGSPLCFLFWLWLGNVGDAGLQPMRAPVNRRLSPSPRFARPVGPVSITAT
jgi:hypothetical protein